MSSHFAGTRALRLPIAFGGVTDDYPITNVLADNVRALCKQRGYWHPATDRPNQSELERRVRKAHFTIDQGTVSRVLAGDGKTKVTTIEAVAAGLGVPAWHLLVPLLNAAETPLLTSFEALERARVATTEVRYGEKKDGRGASRRGANRDGKVNRGRNNSKSGVARGTKA